MSPDTINGLFELAGGLLLLLNVRALVRDQYLRGVSLIPPLFSASCAVWHLYYYANLEQWVSLAGDIIFVIVSSTWLWLAFIYGRSDE